MNESTLRIRWLGRVPYGDALALQRSLFRRSNEQYLLLLEHPHVYTLGVRTNPDHLLADLDAIGAEVVRADRGGDVTYHGPGQLVGYPVLSVAMGTNAIPSHVHRVESLVIETLVALGLSDVGRLDGYPGVWVAPASDSPRKICAVGVRISRGRSMHGFALNVDPDLTMFDHIVPCGIAEYGVTSLRNEGLGVTVRDVAHVIERLAPDLLFLDGTAASEHQSATDAQTTVPAVPRPSRAIERRLLSAGVDPQAALGLTVRKPPHLRVEARMGAEYLDLRRRMRSLSLVTVCEEAGCPNIYECWADGTATFMINGERCTRACGFCLVDTSRPQPIDPAEPERVAEAVAEMHLRHAVVTAVARDDLHDGGADAFARTIEAIRLRSPTTSVEVLIPDLKGDEESLETIFAARPDVLNHNIETVLRLQRAVRPSAGYARSLSVLARAKDARLETKSGVILGMGERVDEVEGALVDLRSVGVDIVTIGQYLRPSATHLPVVRYWSTDEFDEIRSFAEALGFSHVEASPLTRSSYHARQAIERAQQVEQSA